MSIPGFPVTDYNATVVGDEEVTLFWAAPASDGGSAITGYKVTPILVTGSNGVNDYPGVAQTPTTIGVVLTATVTGLTNTVVPNTDVACTRYYFWIEAQNADGLSGFDEVDYVNSTAYAYPGVTPDPPTSLVAVAGSESASASWVAPVDEGTTPLFGYAYRVMRDVDDVELQNGSISDVVLLATGLVPGVAVYFLVAGYNQTGTGTFAMSNVVTPPEPPPIEVVVVERAAPHAEITRFDADEGDGDTRMKATVTDVSKILNEPGSCQIRLPLFHPASALVVPLMCEVQVYRNGEIIAWCVPLQPALQGGDWVFFCPGVLWYFTRRVFGPVSTNYLANPDFATDLTGWSSVDVDSGTRSTAIRLKGPGTLRLVSTTSGDHYAEHTFTVDTSGLGVVLFLAYQYWIDPATPFTATAFEERGLYISSPSSLPDGTPSWEPITMNAPVGQPVRTRPVELHLPADLVDEPVTVRLYSPVCAIHWSGGIVAALESVSSSPEGTDVTEMMRRIVAYMHDIYDYDIPTDTPAAGVTEIMAYQFADLGPCYEALLTYPARGLADFDLVLTPTTRTFTTYAPRKGTYKPGHTLAVPGIDVNLDGYRLDGQQVSTRIIRPGPGEGASREIGFAEDTSFFDGLPLDNVEHAPPEIPVDGLRGLALADLARLSQIVELPEISVAAEGFWGEVDTGDTVDVEIDWGPIQVDTTRRVISMRLNPVTDRVLVGTNVE